VLVPPNRYIHIALELLCKHVYMLSPNRYFFKEFTQPNFVPFASAMAPAACHACGKSDAKLLRCGRCRGVWFCNRECQVLAARQGHSGANCRPPDEGHAPKAVAEVVPRVPDAAGPSTIAPCVDSASLAPAASSCHACGKSSDKLLLCGRCRNAWFCNRECQVVARKELGHRGVSCRPVDGAPSANVRAPFAAPSRLSTATDIANLYHRFTELMSEARQVHLINTRVGYLASAEKCKEAASMADLVGGANGAILRADADQCLANCLVHLENMAAAARAACSSLRAARASGRRPFLVRSLTACGNVARQAPDEMVNAEVESREQEGLGGLPSYGGLDLTHEGQVSLPTTLAALSRLCVKYMEAAVATCESALAAAGGRDSPAADDDAFVPSVHMEAEVRGTLRICLHDQGERQRGLELARQALALLRQGV